MLKIDGKFSTDGERIFNTVSGEAIPADEPLLLLRARDHYAPVAIDAYQGACEADCNELHLAGVQQVREKFCQFAAEHPERMKQPGVTRHLVLEHAQPRAAEQGLTTEQENVLANHRWEQMKVRPGCVECGGSITDADPTATKCAKHKCKPAQPPAGSSCTCKGYETDISCPLHGEPASVEPPAGDAQMVSLDAVEEAVRQELNRYGHCDESFAPAVRNRLAKPEEQADVDRVLDVFEKQGYVRADVTRFAAAIVAALKAGNQ